MCEHMRNWSWDFFLPINKQTKNAMLMFPFYKFLLKCFLPTHDFENVKSHPNPCTNIVIFLTFKIMHDVWA